MKPKHCVLLLLVTSLLPTFTWSNSIYPVACPDMYKGYYACVRHDWDSHCGIVVVRKPFRKTYGLRWSKAFCYSLEALPANDLKPCHVWIFPDMDPQCIVGNEENTDARLID